MTRSVRPRLWAMMFLQYFVMGAWTVPIATYLMALPTDGGLFLSPMQLFWLVSSLAIGGLVTPPILALLADRWFAGEKVLAGLHLANAAVMIAMAGSCARHAVSVREAFHMAAAAHTVTLPDTEETYSLLDTLKQEKETRDSIERRRVELRRLGRTTILQRLYIQQPYDVPHDDPSEHWDAHNLELLKPANRSALDHLATHPDLRRATGAAFWPLLAFSLAAAVCYMPTTALANNLALRHLGDPDKQFSTVQIFGILGWVAAGWVVGLALNAVSHQPMLLAGAASAVLGLYALTLPHSPPVTVKKIELKPRSSLAWIWRDRSFLVFSAVAVAATALMSFPNLFANKFLEDLRMPAPAALQTLGQITEAVCMLVVPVALPRLGVKGMLLVALAAWALRYGLFATSHDAAILFLGLPLHGLGYAFFYIVATLYVDRMAPPESRAAAQGLITFASLGVGFLVGNLLAALVVQANTSGATVDWPRVWAVPLVGSLAAAVVFAVLFRGPAEPAPSACR
jgi:nucleoside transporter